MLTNAALYALFSFFFPSLVSTSSSCFRSSSAALPGDTPLRRGRLRAQKRVENLLVQSLAGGHHGEDMLVSLDEALHDDGLGAVVLEELLHLRREFLAVVAAEALDAHRLGELDEVRVRHPGVRVPGVVEEV
jgi:hypothetical protein